MLNIKNISKEQKALLQAKVAEALVRYASGTDHSAGYDVIRYAKAGLYTVNDEIFRT